MALNGYKEMINSNVLLVYCRECIQNVFLMNFCGTTRNTTVYDTPFLAAIGVSRGRSFDQRG